MTKRIFITGAAGFIGFHLSIKLASLGYHLTGFDNFNDYYSPLIKRERAKILRDLGIDIVEGDICDFPFLQSVVNQYPTTHFVHLAAQAGVRYSIKNPQAYVKSNLEGFVNILEICRLHPHIPLIYASSSSVYGLNEKTPFSTEDPVNQQASLYGVTKRTNELLANTYHHLYGIPMTGLRFFTVYGPWGRPDMAYYSFTKAILEGRPIEVYNEGKLKRDFTYIDDIVNGIVSAIEKPGKNELYNLGNNTPVEVNAFIAILEKLLNKKAEKHFLPMQKGDVTSTFADISKSQKELHFNPSTSIENGLEKFVEWYMAKGKNLGA